MSINTENNAATDLVQDKVETNLEQEKVESNPRQQIETVKQEEKVEDPNWRAFREGRKQDRINREAAEKRAAEKEAEVAALKAAMEAAFAKSNLPLQNSLHQGYAEEETEDQRIEKKVQQALEQREQQRERERAQREAQEYPKRLAREYSDFESTISESNLDYLEYHYPEIAGPLKELPDNYNKWAHIYKIVKKFVPNSANAKSDALRAENNLSKPKSISSQSISPPGTTINPYILSEERKAANWAAMQKRLKGLG